MCVESATHYLVYSVRFSSRVDVRREQRGHPEETLFRNDPTTCNHMSHLWSSHWSSLIERLHEAAPTFASRSKRQVALYLYIARFHKFHFIDTSPGFTLRVYGFRLVQLFRGAASPEDVQKLSTVEAGSVDYLGVQFFSEVFLGLWHDVHGNEVRMTTHPSY